MPNPVVIICMSLATMVSSIITRSITAVIICIILVMTIIDIIVLLPQSVHFWAVLWVLRR